MGGVARRGAARRGAARRGAARRGAARRKNYFAPVWLDELYASSQRTVCETANELYVSTQQPLYDHLATLPRVLITIWVYVRTLHTFSHSSQCYFGFTERGGRTILCLLPPKFHGLLSPCPPVPASMRRNLTLTQTQSIVS